MGISRDCIHVRVAHSLGKLPFQSDRDRAIDDGRNLGDLRIKTGARVPRRNNKTIRRIRRARNVARLVTASARLRSERS